ncbi:MAG: acyl-CoA dehydrogenase family protein [Dehalococcoidia bacterium]|nr:acyl-CoA dehydrogenase family protein [Dehalococcoidia bacterium]
MIGFALSEEQRLFQETIRDFARREVAPIAREYDEREEYPIAILRKMGELGYLGVPFAQVDGGAGGDSIMAAVMSEEMGYVSAGVYLGVYVHVFLALNAISRFGTDDQKLAYLAPGIRGERVGAWAFAEPDAGSDPGSMTTRARRDGDDYVIDGTKLYITNGSIADFVVLTASTDPRQGMKGLSLFIVDAGTPGFTVPRRLRKLGVRASDTAELAFNDCRVPASALLGAENVGFVNAMRVLTAGRVVSAAFALGTARAAFDQSLAHVKSRHAFGHAIGDFQGIQWQLADMALELECAKLLTWQAAWLADQGLPHIKEASMAKLYATEMCARLTGQAILLHGASGYMMDSDIQRFYRDVKVMEIGEGTSHIQRNTIARQIGL